MNIKKLAAINGVTVRTALRTGNKLLTTLRKRVFVEHLRKDRPGYTNKQLVKCFDEYKKEVTTALNIAVGEALLKGELNVGLVFANNTGEVFGARFVPSEAATMLKRACDLFNCSPVELVKEFVPEGPKVADRP